MANSLTNFTRSIAEEVLGGFESKRTLSKNVNTQKLDGKFNPRSGTITDFARPTDYTSVRTATGDVSGEDASDIIDGKASGIVQDYITVFVDYDEADEALKMGNLKEKLAPASTRIKTDLEVDFAAFMMKNTGLLSGTVGTALTTWDHVAGAAAMMDATGVPSGEWCMGVNSFTQRKLAGVQRSLGSVDPLISEAHRKAIISEDFAGIKVMTATTLASYTTGTGADRAGTLSGTPTVTYLSVADSMQQSIAVTALQANLVVSAGETITITGRNRLNLNTRQVMLDDTGATILFSGTVLETVTLNGSGAGTLVISGPAVYEASGAYNTVDSSPVSGDVVTLGGAATTIIQPNLFWDKNAFSIGSVPMKKLYSTDTIATTEDGLQLRVSKGTGFLENSNKVRIDMRPAFAVLNPFYAGQAYGS